LFPAAGPSMFGAMPEEAAKLSVEVMIANYEELFFTV
jgi:hypothetical protein